MESKDLSCAGCFEVIISKSHLKCCICHGAYDLACAGLNENRFHSNYSISTAAGKKRRAVWECPTCVSKKRKGGNLDTPVRSWDVNTGVPPSSAVSEGSPSDNVTLRTKQIADNDITALIRTEIKAAIRSEFSPIKSQLNDLQKSVEFITQQYDDLLKTTNSIMDSYKTINSDTTRLSTTVVTLTERINNLEQHLRETNLEFHGVPQRKDENTVEVIKKVADIVSFKLDDRELLNCTRVASMNKDSKRPRTIVVKLCSPRRRDEFYSAVARYNKAHSNSRLSSSSLGFGGDPSIIYVSEHLSPANKALHYAARIKTKELSYKFVWVRNGRIFVRKDEISKFIHVKNQQTLDSLV